VILNKRKAGRPATGGTKSVLNTKIETELREWLRRQKNQVKTVEKALKEYRVKYKL